MVGHTYYGTSGEYEATGLGTVILEHETDQIRWVATSSGKYEIKADTVEYIIGRVTASPLPSIGFDFMSEEERIKFASEFVTPINDENVSTTSRIRSLTTTELIVEEDGATWTCHRTLETSK